MSEAGSVLRRRHLQDLTGKAKKTMRTEASKRDAHKIDMRVETSRGRYDIHVTPPYMRSGVKDFDMFAMAPAD